MSIVDAGLLAEAGRVAGEVDAELRASLSTEGFAALDVVLAEAAFGLPPEP